MTEQKLKPCPFCGGKAKVWEDLFIRFSWTTYCVKCGASVREGTKEKVIEAWNKRVGEVAE